MYNELLAVRVEGREGNTVLERKSKGEELP